MNIVVQPQPESISMLFDDSVWNKDDLFSILCIFYVHGTINNINAYLHIFNQKFVCVHFLVVAVTTFANLQEFLEIILTHFSNLPCNDIEEKLTLMSNSYRKKHHLLQLLNRNLMQYVDELSKWKSDIPVPLCVPVTVQYFNL